MPGQTIHLAVICVFCVHHLPASALEFLLCNAADKRLRMYCRTGDSADAPSIASDGIEPIPIGLFDSTGGRDEFPSGLLA